ncbi:efflux RND transporter periplasmic adaptor subunit [Pontibacillus litoralis]|uniref:Uncharacterized protein n=1 Tax=Pontibacillus litoralis JSM 072002 TaxID=1385512 RepID=A0A0A5G5I9_9BACI|nr:efflux RND transporter periplasmic adaptor subunit [Pontibacillus litoralis]KGX86423.1 hypothetical protein N784_04530 [Pontibacillus litoralis JSM 072002]
MKKNILAMLLLILLVTLSACAEEKSSEQPKEEPVTPVQVMKVKKGDLQVEREVYGRAIPGSQSSIVPKATGELVELTIERGDVVKEGQSIGRVDTGNVQDNVELQQLAVQSAQKQLDGATSQKEAAAQNVTDAKEQLEEAKQATNKQSESNVGSTSELEKLLKTATDNEKEMKQLVESGAVSEKEYNQIVEQVEILTQQLAQAQKAAQASAGQSPVAQAEMAVKQAEQQLDSAKIGVEQAKLQVEQAQTQLEQAKGQLQNGAITSNQSGEVVSLEVKQGDMVSNTQPMATVVDLNPIKVEANVSAEELKLFEEGKKVPVAISSVKDKFKAEITYIPSVTNDSGLYPVEATIANSDEQIKPGMMVTFQLPEVTVKKQLLVPTQAIVEEGGKAYVYVVEEERAKKKPIEIVRSQSRITAVKGDLKKGDPIVTKGQLTLSDDNKVNIMKEDTK